MKVLRELARRLAGGETLGLATVVGTEGSSPGRPAMKLLVSEEGRIAGTIGGGHVEKSVIAEAQATLGSGNSKLLSFTLDDDEAEEGGLICGGTVHIFTEKVAPPAAWVQAALELMESGGRGVLLTYLGERPRRELLVGPEAEAWLEREDPRIEEDRYVEPIAQPRCVVVGAGHVGAATARLARSVGFHVALVEDRPATAGRMREEGFEHVVLGPLVEGIRSLGIGAGDYVVSTTRGTGLDLECVEAALRAGPRYVGMLGSHRKAERIRTSLAAAGVPSDVLHSPVGLDLGSQTAPEIALSIVGQMVRLRRTGRADR